MSKPWPKATIESDRPPRQRSDTKALYRLGDKLVEAHEMESLRRESGTHPVPRDPDSAAVSIEPPARNVDVLLWFDEIEEPVRAHAELRGTRLRVRAPLSLLRIGSQLHYTLIESGAAATARVDRIALASEPGPAIPILELELHGDAPPALDTSGEGKREATASDADDSAVVAADAGVTEEAIAAKPEPSPSRAGRWLGLLCAGALGLAGGAAATKRLADEHYAQRIAGEREIAAREIAAVRAAAHPPRAPFRAVPDEPSPLPPPAPAPSLLRHEVLPSMDALEIATSVAVAPPTAPDPAAASVVPLHADGDRLPRVTVEDQVTTIVIPMRGSGDGMKSYPLTTPGVVLTLPKAFALIPPGNHEPSRGLARRIGVRKYGAGTQVKVLYRSMAVRPRIAYDPAVGVAITLQRTW